MAITNETLPHDGGFLVSEANGSRSREKVTILAGSGAVRTLEAGTVLGKITASGKYIAVVEGASDGSETPVAIILNRTVAPDGADIEAAIVARDAEVNVNELIWPGTYDATNITAGRAALLAVGIVCRDAI
jgi:hypothetical protein